MKTTKTGKEELKIDIKNLEGKKVGERKLSQEIFAKKPNFDLIKQVYSVIYANQRQVIAHTKNRSERAGSTRKPWRQKGTGRARTGSVRNPIWRKGGVVFGPTKERNFKKKVNVKMKQLAMKMVLSGKVKDQELIVVDGFNPKEKKTKEMAKGLSKIGTKNKSTLLAFYGKEVENERISRNIEKVSSIEIEKLNVFDVLNAKFLVISQEGLDYLEKKYSKNFKQGSENQQSKETTKETTKDQSKKAKMV